MDSSQIGVLLLNKTPQAERFRPAGSSIHSIFNESKKHYQGRNVRILNELRWLRESRVEPIAHMVSNLHFCEGLMGRKDSSRPRVRRRTWATIQADPA